MMGFALFVINRWITKPFLSILSHILMLFSLLLLLPDGVLIVVHPHLEDLPADPDLGAELLHQRLVLLLDPPSHPLRKIQHPLLLLRGELGPESLLGRHIWPLRRRRPRVQLLAGRLRGRAPAGSVAAAEE